MHAKCLNLSNVCLFQGFITPNNENKEETVVVYKKMVGTQIGSLTMLSRPFIWKGK